jgi:hypothetical protein
MKATSSKEVAWRTQRRSGDVRLLEVAGRITERDRLICRLLFDHRVLTSAEVADVGFGTLRKAQQRLSVLYDLGVVERFRPQASAGSAPLHFILGAVGASVVAAERGVDLSALDWRREVSTALATSRHLGHLVGCNGFFTALIRSARHGGASSLEEWWSARRCAAAWGDAVRPDGYGVWADHGVRLPFCFEYDNGTETLARLEAKLGGYAKLARAVEHPTWVLFRFPTAGREAAARPVLTHLAVPVATAVIEPGQAADGPLWLAVGDRGPRRRLADLGHPDRALALVQNL